jgi:hypothetical protein
MSFRGQTIFAKMMSPVGKLATLECHPTKRVKKAEELNYLSTNIGSVSIVSHLLAGVPLLFPQYGRCAVESIDISPRWKTKPVK